MKKRVKLGKYKTVFRGINFDVKQAKATFPNGAIKVFERVTRAPSVVILPIDKDGKLLLTREYRMIYKKYKWWLPSGKVDKNESPISAAKRELREEAGYKAKKMKLFHLSIAGQSLDWKRYVYVATGLIKAPLEGDADEDITIVPTSIKNAMELVIKGEIDNELIAYSIMKLYYKHL